MHHRQIREYFENSYYLDELVFTAIKGERMCGLFRMGCSYGYVDDP